MTETRTITEERLRVLLDCYGGQAERWPEPEREAALALLAARPELEAERAKAAELDGLLVLAERPSASGALVGRLVEAVPRRKRHWLAEFWPFGPAWQPAFGLAIALLLGLASGPLLPRTDSAQPTQVETTEEIALLLATPVYAEDDL